MVKHDPEGVDCRECLICGQCHEYISDYTVCEMRELEVQVFSIKFEDLEELEEFMRPRGKDQSPR